MKTFIKLFTFSLVMFSFSFSAFADGVVFATEEDLKAFDSLVLKSSRRAKRRRVAEKKIDTQIAKIITAEKKEVKAAAGSKATGSSSKKDTKGSSSSISSAGGSSAVKKGLGQSKDRAVKNKGKKK